MSKQGRRAQSVIEEQAYLPILLQSSPEYQQDYGGELEKEIPRSHTLEQKTNGWVLVTGTKKVLKQPKATV